MIVSLRPVPPGVILDGEAVIVVDGVISFEAAQSRAASAPARRGSWPTGTRRCSSSGTSSRAQARTCAADRTRSGAPQCWT
ncbi:hypothetical protein E4K10_04695 [Streptomyces sp. T1317-0309]|nr:hypothetical protein E4K10_04695 [Streptomyces sp. T1317-0309]